ncbi:MAG: ATP-binding protein [Candidatus Micrarchaeota archaeon]
MYLVREEETSLFELVHKREALALIGPRQAGKTTLAKRLLEQWVAQGREGQYIDLEAVNAPANAEELQKAISKTARGGLVVLDEVQAAQGWVRAVREEIENKRRQIIISGSSAKLLSSEVATSLAGRAMPQTILPLSYSNARAWGVKTLEQYMKGGGYPECVLNPADAPKLHRLYFELTVLRDVSIRHNIRETKALSDLAVLLLSESAKTISTKKTSHALGISPPTLRSFAHALADAYLVLPVLPFLRSPRERIVADAKYYAMDVGMQKTISISQSDDFGRRCENLIAIELKRRGYELSYLRGDGWECDFIAQAYGRPALAIQVWSGDEKKPPQREIGGLLKGMKGAKAGGLLLSYQDAEVAVGGFEVKKIEDWLLEGAKP